MRSIRPKSIGVPEGEALTGRNQAHSGSGGTKVSSVFQEVRSRVSHLLSWVCEDLIVQERHRRCTNARISTKPVKPTACARCTTVGG